MGQIVDFDTMIRKAEIKRLKDLKKINAYSMFLYYNGMLSREEQQRISIESGYSELYKYGQDKYVEELLMHNNQFSMLIDSLVDLYKKYYTGYYDIKGYRPFEHVVVGFFKYMGCLDLYQRMQDEGRIERHNKTIDRSYCFIGEDLSYISISEKNQLPKFIPEVSMVHEMAHTLFNHVNADRITKDNFFPTPIEGEILTKFFERAFFDFLEDVQSLDKDFVKRVIKNKETMNYSTIKDMAEIHKVLNDPNGEYDFLGLNFKYKKRGIEKSQKLHYHNYIVGNIVSASLFEEFLKDRDYFINHLDDIIRDLHGMPILKAILECQDTKPLENYLDTHLVKRKVMTRNKPNQE